MPDLRSLVLLGSTGSIGTQALDLVDRIPDRFRVVGLAAGGERVDLLAAQALRYGVEVVAVAKATAAQDLLLAFYAEAQQARLRQGAVRRAHRARRPDAASELAAMPCDVVLNGMTGSVGLGADAGGAASRHARSRWPTRSR